MPRLYTSLLGLGAALLLWAPAAVTAQQTPGAGTSPEQASQAEPKPKRQPGGGRPDGTLVSEPGDDWHLDPARWFVSGMFDLGYLYVRPRFSLGYGKPHARWIGLDANPILTGGGLAFYTGLRIDLDWLNWRIGARGRYAFERSFLCPTADRPQPAPCQSLKPLDYYNRDDLDVRTGPGSVYVSLESELTFEFDIGPGEIDTEYSVTAVTGVDEGYFVYEETRKVIVDPPWILRGRFAYLHFFDRNRAIRAGPVVEVLYVPGRRMPVLRGGFLGRIRIDHHWEGRATFLPALLGKDQLTAAGGDTFLLGVRYRFSTY